VVIPRLEYLLQNVIITARIAEAIAAPLKNLLKARAHLPLSHPDASLYSNLFFNITNLFINQLKAYASLLQACLHTPSLQPMMLQQIKFSLLELWSPSLSTNLLLHIYPTFPRNRSYFTRILWLLAKYEIHFIPSDIAPIAGGSTSLVSILSPVTPQLITSLSSKQLMFFEQLVSLDGSILLNWKQIQLKNGQKFKGRIPKWFRSLEDRVILNPNTRRC
jgi:hypothetical protein